jgi:hypothetical protein
MLKTITLTIPQYAEQIGKKRQSVLMNIKRQQNGKDKSHLLPRLISFKKVGRDYLLQVLPS